MVGGVRAPAPCRETQPWSRQVSASPSAGILCSGRGRQTGGGGDDAGLGEELGQLKRGGRRPMSRTGPCSVAEDVGMGGILYKSKENTS